MIRKFNEIITNVLLFPVDFYNPDSCRDWNWLRKELLLKLIMRTLIFLFCTTLFSLAPNYGLSQNEKIFINEDQVVSVDEIFKIIKSQTEYTFVYHGHLFKDFPKIKLKKGVVRLNVLLKESFPTDNLNIIFAKNNTIYISKKTHDNKALQHSVSGTVSDQSGIPIPGATVLIKGTTKGTATNLDGHYTITVPNPANVLVFSFLGFETQEITVGNQATIDVTLKESINALDEVTINAGYYKVSERERTGSISKIEAKDIEKQPVNNPLAAMQGYIPGVNITQNTGLPGSGFNIQIRGKNFLNAGTEPFYVVDGVPYSSEALSGSGITDLRLNSSPLDLIHPSDIESIEVLRDADATAIYGSRGANGVVLITTKKGKAGKTQIRVDLSNSLGSVPRFVDLLNTEQYLEMRLEALNNDGYTIETAPIFVQRLAPDLFEWDQNRYTDWQEVLIGGTAHRHKAQLSFSGGNAQTQFLLSGGSQHETTVILGDSKYSKASLHTNINHQSVDEHLHVNVSTNYVADDNRLPVSSLTELSYRLAPNAPELYDENGNLNWENSTWQNPLASLEDKFRSKTKNILINSMISYKPVATLEFKVNLGYTDYRKEDYRIRPHTSYDPVNQYTSANSGLITNNSSRTSWVVEPQVNWKKDWDKASLNVLAGIAFQHQQENQISHSASGFASNSQILDLSAANIAIITLDQENEYKYQSFFGRLNFTWSDKYIVNLTGRRDGSSRFGPGRQFGNFGAIGAAWLFSEEPFFKDNHLLSFGKLRSSYGITGSDGIGNYNFYDSYETSSINYVGAGLIPTRLFNPIFAWEENKKFEIALELGFFRDRFKLTTAWYRNRSSNQLVGIPLPGTTGFSSVTSNFDAIVENTGLEIDFHSVNIQKKHFKWTTIFNISIPKNKLVKFDGLENSTFRNQYVVGEPLNISKRYHMTGVDPDTGTYQFEDYNNDGEITFDGDRQLIVHTAPKFYGGFGNTFNYKNWSLDVLLRFKKHWAPNMHAYLGRPGSGFNQHISILSRWQEVGDQTSIQRYSMLGTTGADSAFQKYAQSNAIYEDASFIQLRNISLTYTIPKESISGINTSIYLHAQNLFVLSKSQKSDPEWRGGPVVPILRQFTLGLQLGF